MYELKQAINNTYYIASPSKCGIYVSDGEAILIDSGNDKEAGRKINQHINAQGWTLKTIINTHANADHIGGNAFLTSRTGASVRANGMEQALTLHPFLSPALLYGGYPPKALQTKFLLAQATDDVEPIGNDLKVQTFPLPGHFLDMVGVRTPDDVVFLADVVFDEAIIEKYHVNFLFDIGAYLKALDDVEKMEAALFIPAHSEPTQDIRPLVRANRDKVHEIIELLLGFCKDGMTTENIVKELFTHYNLTMSLTQHVLIGSTVKSYLSYLVDDKRLEIDFADNLLIWKRT